MKRGLVRIIGGQWRGRRLSVPDVAGLRPTPDRVRETVFNWLGTRLPGCRCLDAFAGTGALGFEAASRGAAHVVMTEVSSVALSALSEAKEKLEALNVEIIRASQPDGLTMISGPFDIVFLDPPWQQVALLTAMLTALVEQEKLAPDARVYLETPAAFDVNALPEGWCILKQTRAGEVHGTLVACE